MRHAVSNAIGPYSRTIDSQSAKPDFLLEGGWHPPQELPFQYLCRETPTEITCGLMCGVLNYPTRVIQTSVNPTKRLGFLVSNSCVVFRRFGNLETTSSIAIRNFSAATSPGKSMQGIVKGDGS
jgi:hypothetical protein